MVWQNSQLTTEQRSADAVQSVVEQIVAWATAGQSAPRRLLGGAEEFLEWTHYPQPDSINPQSGWRYYYHTHPPQQRLTREHGHFHIFVPGPDQPDAGPDRGFSHLVGLSVDEKGLPLRLFTTNRWVTGENWRPATELVAFLRSPALGSAQPEDISLWLDNLLILFADDIRTLLYARDRRLASMMHNARHDRKNDRRLRIPSQCKINLLQRIQTL